MSLKGTGVWVTRPGKRSQKLCDLIADAGGVAYGFPVTQIKPLSDDIIKSQMQLLPKLWDGIIVVSGYAAELGLTRLTLPESDQPPKLFAIGRATQRILADLGFKSQSALKQKEFTSEGLLALPGLQNVSGESWLIIKGKGGRSTLANTLTQRGASAHTLEVYTRVPSTHIPKEIVKHLKNRDIHLVTVTSVDILRHLVELIGPTKPELEMTALVVPSKRVKEQVNKLLPKARVLLASSATDEDMVTCMINAKRMSYD